MTIAFPARAFRRQRERTPGLLFAFGVDDLSSESPTGQTLTFDRNSGRSVLDAAGRVASLAYDQWPWSMHYNSDAGVYEPVYDAQHGRTNLCLRSEDFGTTWSAIGTPTRTAAAKTCGDVALDLIGDDAAGTLEGYSQVVSFTGNAVKAVSLFMAAGTSTSTAIRLRDTTASANRLLAVITWSGGVPSVAMTTGTDVETIACYGGVYRFLFQTTSVTAANTNQIEVYPATNSALVTTSTGTIYVGGVQAENDAYCGPYLKTLGSTVTSVADTLTTTLDLPIADFTVYARVMRPWWAGVSGGASPVIVGLDATPTTNGTWFLWFDNSTATSYAYGQIGKSGGQVGQSAAIPAGAMIEICAQFQDLDSGPSVRLDVGSGFGSWSSAGTAFTSWDSTTVGIGGDPTSSTLRCGTGIRRIAIAAGLRTLSELRGPQP